MTSTTDQQTKHDCICCTGGYCKKQPYGLVANGLRFFFTFAVLQCMQNRGLCCTSLSRNGKATYRLDIITNISACCNDPGGW